MSDEERDGGLARTLGPVEVTASGVGLIIGAGIYVLLGPATQLAGATVWISFLVSAALCALTGLSYAELASMFPRSGAEYEYARQIAPEPVAFVVGWTMVAGLVVAASTIALGFGRYLRAFVDVPPRVAALLVLLIVGLVGAAGIKRATWVVLALSAVQAGGLVVVIVVGAGHIGEVDLSSGPGSSGVFAATALVFFAFIGFDEVITLSEETRNPTRTVPRALLASLAISAALYALVSITAVSVLSPAELGRSERPLADVVRHVLGTGGVRGMSVVALLTTTNTTLLAVTAASRLTFGMAERGSLPRSALRLSRRRVPIVTLAGTCVVAAGLAMVGDLAVVAGAADFAVYVVFLAVNAAVIVLRFRRPDAPRPFRSPLTIGRGPVLAVLGTVATLAMLPRLQVGSLWVGAALVGVGALVAAVPARRRAAAVEAGATNEI